MKRLLNKDKDGKSREPDLRRLSHIEKRRSIQGMELIRKESQHITDFLSKGDSDSESSSSSDEEKQKSKNSWNLGSILKSRTSEFDHARENTRQSLRASLAGCEVNKRLVNKFGSVKAILSENERIEAVGLFVIHPYSNFRFAWDMLTLVMLLLNVVLVPVFMAFPAFEFNSRQKVEDQTQAKVAMYFRLISDIWFSIDVALNFRTGIVEDGSHNQIIIDAREIRRRYLRGWFALDLISTFPFDIAVSFFSHFGTQDYDNLTNSTRFFRYFRLTKLFQLLRLLRVSRIWRYMHQWDEMFNLSYESGLLYLRTIGALVCLLLFAHVSACIQFMVPMIMNYPQDTWVRVRGFHKVDTSTSEQYGWSFFRAVSQMLCIGYGQFPPSSMVDMYVTTLLMLLGAICFAVFIGYLTSIIQSHNSSKRLYAEKYSSVKHYMIFRKLPMELRKRISDYYENRYQGKMFNETQILRELNPVLRDSIVNSNCRELVDSVPFFQKADPEFVSALVNLLKFEVYLFNDEIIREGTIGRKMFFISRGTVRVCSSKAPTTFLTDGSFFGEISLILPNLRRVASVHADSYCYLYRTVENSSLSNLSISFSDNQHSKSLAVEDFNSVLEDFPMQRKHFYAEAGKRLEQMKSEAEENGDQGRISKQSIKMFKRRKTKMSPSNYSVNR